MSALPFGEKTTEDHTMLTKELFGTKLKELRMERSLSQRQLAEMMMVSNGTVGNWESGIRLPDITMLTRLAECLGVEL